MDEQTLRATLASQTPHRLTERNMARMAVKRDEHGGRYVDPLLIAAWEQEGLDPEPIIRRLLELDAAED